MKRLVVALLAVMVCFTGCSKEDGEGKVTPENVFRGKRLSESSPGGNYKTKYSYDQNGLLTKVTWENKVEDKVVVENEFTFTYTANTVKIICENESGGKGEDIFKLNKNGFAESGISTYTNDGETEKYEYYFKYTNDGYLSEVKSVSDNGTDIQNFKYKDGNLTSWSEDGNYDDCAVGSRENKGGLLPFGFFEVDALQDIYYAGLLGKATKNLLTECGNEMYTYVYDKDGYVTQLDMKTNSGNSWTRYFEFK